MISSRDRSWFHYIKIELHAKCYVHLKTALKHNTVDFADNRNMFLSYNRTNIPFHTIKQTVTSREVNISHKFVIPPDTFRSE